VSDHGVVQSGNAERTAVDDQRIGRGADPGAPDGEPPAIEDGIARVGRAGETNGAGPLIVDRHPTGTADSPAESEAAEAGPFDRQWPGKNDVAPERRAAPTLQYDLRINQTV